MSAALPYSYIAIEGNIGAGKTSLAKILSNKYNGRLVLEEFADNTFLPQFYEQPERFAFPLEMSFLAERYQQISREQQAATNAGEILISDYIFEKSLLFASVNLTGDELHLFNRFFSLIQKGLQQPGLMLYLHRSTPQLLQNISLRGREFEKSIPFDYLERISHSYLNYLKGVNEFPVVVINSDKLDFVNKPSDLRLVLDLLTKPHGFGFQEITI
jgi:deoxyadenosine/deoxycytidine kinase